MKLTDRTWKVLTLLLIGVFTVVVYFTIKNK